MLDVTQRIAALCALGLAGFHSSPVEAQTQTGTLVVVNKQAATANIIDLPSGRTLATLPTGDGPHEVSISRDGRTAVVTNYAGGNSLTVIDIPGLAVARTIDLASYPRPHGIAFAPGDSLVAVTSESTGTVVFVRISDGEITRTVSTDQGGSHMLAMVGDGGRVFTSNISDNSVSELDIGSGTRTRTISVSPQPEAITVTESGDEVWVGSNQRGTVSVIDTESGEVDEVLEGFEWPYRILIVPDRSTVLIPDLRKNVLRFVDRGERRDIAMMEFPSGGPQGIAISGDATVAYLSLSRRNRIAVIDIANREVTGYIDTGAGPDGIGYSPIRVAR